MVAAVVVHELGPQDNANQQLHPFVVVAVVAHVTLEPSVAVVDAVAVAVHTAFPSLVDVADISVRTLLPPLQVAEAVVAHSVLC